MAWQASSDVPSGPLTLQPRPAPARRSPRPSPAARTPEDLPRWSAPVWCGVCLLAAAVAVAWILFSDERPSYDCFGWLVWGQQILHGTLNLDGAPSWKPLTFLFTLPYALAGHNPQMWLWMITATTATVLGSVAAGRIAFRLTRRSGGTRPWAPWVGALFAGVGVLGLDGYSHLIMIANSDPLIVSLLLGAIDAHLGARRRVALVFLVLAGLGRPEAWALAALYCAWSWFAEPRMRWLAVLGFLVLPAGWFIAPGLASHSIFSAGDLALGQKTIIHGNKIIGVIQRLRSLYTIPMQVAVAASALVAVARRDREWLGLLAAAAVWIVIEIGFAYHGWSAVSRYLIEPGAVLVVLAGAGVGTVLAWPGRAARRPASGHRWTAGRAPTGVRPTLGHMALGHMVLGLAGPALVVVLLVALVPTMRNRARTTHGEIDESKGYALELTRLQHVIARLGGPRAILDCGQPVTLLGTQSEVAWIVGLSVGPVGFRPGQEIREGRQVVEVKGHDEGWQVRPFNTPARCTRLRTDSAMS